MMDTNKKNLATEPAAVAAPATADVSNTSNTTPAEATTAATAPATTTTPADSGNIPAALAWMVSAHKIELTRSKHGLPCLWESGGGWKNTGEAQIITDGQGYPKIPIHVRTHGDRACGDHALIPVQEGDHVITVSRHRDKATIEVERIEEIVGDSATVVTERDPICIDAIIAAIEKSNDYHCYHPYYVN